MIKIVRVGFGIVSQGLAEIILSTNWQLPIPEQTEVQTEGIIELMKGSKIDAQGINMQEVLKNAEKGDDSLLTDSVIDVTKTIQEINADIVIEASFTDIKTGQPAIAHIEAALKSNKHVVTKNKGPFALAFKQIFNLAKEKSKTVAVEGTVISGTPIINVLNRAFRGKNKCC
jgi:homoserine dehydrogenase